MGQENLAVPKNSVVIILKFNSQEDRSKAINSEKFDGAIGELTALALSLEGSLSSKTSRN